MLLLLLLAGLGRCSASFETRPSALPRAAYPSWAHYHWVWLGARNNNQSSALQNVASYLERNISVGATDWDSQWATCDNSFVFNASKFPSPRAAVASLLARGVRTILWATGTINTDCQPLYAEAEKRGFLLRSALHPSRPAVFKWWHGRGSFVDVGNPEARSWWHSLLDAPLRDVGVSGWKNDGTDMYVVEFGALLGHAGKVYTRHEYSNAYYGDFFNYSRSINPEALIMSRPVDSYENKVYASFSPRNVVFAGWVGDQDATFGGLKDALNNMLHSAWQNYVSFGSDTAGYRSGNRTRELFLRWAQLNAFMGLFENGGENDHQPWAYEPAQETTAIYKDFVDIHMRFSSYMLTHGSIAYEQGHSLIRPLARKPLLGSPSTYDYMLGPDVFVSPIREANVRNVSVAFPAGSRWVDLWDPSVVYEGGKRTVVPVPLSRYPAYLRAGAMFVLERTTPNNADWMRDDRDVDLYIALPTPGKMHHASIRKYSSASQEFRYHFDATTRKLRLWVTPHTRRVSLVVAGKTLAADLGSGAHSFAV